MQSQTLPVPQLPFTRTVLSKGDRAQNSCRKCNPITFEKLFTLSFIVRLNIYNFQVKKFHTFLITFFFPLLYSDTVSLFFG
jgi:hypothetical protein